MGRPPYRRYASVQEYHDAMGDDLSEGDTTFLLIDNQTTIDKVRQYHNPGKYHWRHLDGP